MILRASKKSAAPTDQGVSGALIRALAPFAEVHDTILNSVAQHSHKLTPGGGIWKSGQADHLYFLTHGAARLSAENQTTRKLHAQAAACRFPLPDADLWQIELTKDAELIGIPARYLELDHSQHGEENLGVELSDDTVSGEVYLQFYQALKEGKYELPSMPDLAVRIGKAIDDPNTLNEDIARLIQMDPSLAARVMSVVNSAAYGAGEKISSLQVAVARLGRQAVRNLVFSCIIKGLYRTDSQVLNKRMQQLWRHSCRVAAISFVLAKVTPGLDPNRALLAGLIHDIGAIPILQTARQHPQAANDLQLINQLIDSLKAEIGALTLHQWHFDLDMIDLARDAEHWHRVGTAIPDYLDVVLIAQLHAFIGTPEAAQMNLPPIDRIPAFYKLALGQLTPRHSLGVIENASKEIDEVERLLN